LSVPLPNSILSPSISSLSWVMADITLANSMLVCSHASHRGNFTLDLPANRPHSVYMSELFPTWMRAQGVAFSVAGLFSGTLIYTGAASDAFAAVGWRYYLGTSLVFLLTPFVRI
jgi:hypothetical protein